MKTININGTEYIEKSAAMEYTDAEHVCIIADRGWIFEGYRVEGGEGVRLTNANVVRRWDNGLGIGGLADPDHKDDYTLDAIGDIEIVEHAVIATIPLRW